MKAFFSKLGQSFMLPIALLPAAGIMLGIGGSFTSSEMIKAYNLEGILGAGTILNGLLTIMNAAGDVIFGNLPLMFAIAVAIAFAKRDKGTAALAAVMSYLIMNAVGSATIAIFAIVDLNSLGELVINGNPVVPAEYFKDGGLPVQYYVDFINAGGTITIAGIGLKQGIISTTLGLSNTMSTGVFGGIIAGGISAILHNKYSSIKLPDFLGFFAGPRFVPIVASFAALFYGILLVFVWPFVGGALNQIGSMFIGLEQSGFGWIASFIHGYIERGLIPLGLHHVYYLPLWQTSVGGAYDFSAWGGTLVYGTQNAFFQALSLSGIKLPADTVINGVQYAAGAPAWDLFPATNFMTGKFPFMMFGLPAAAYAMYSVADTENKKEAGGLLFSVAFTALLTGITEPIEFTFLFLAPGLYYGVHAVLAATSFAVMDFLNVKVGQTFSGGFIDFLLFGILPWSTGAQNNVWYIVIFGIILIPLYYFSFKWWILKFDVKTPGRKGAEVKTVSKQEYRDMKSKDEGNSNNKETNLDYDMAVKILDALGGDENIESVDACITRLRVAVKDEDKVAKDEVFTNELAAMGVSKNGKAIQVIYGQQAAVYKDIINDEILS